MTARDPTDLQYLHKLYKQGLTNGVDLKIISRQEALEMEPALTGFGDEVIYSPTTAVMDINQAMDHMAKTLPSNVTLVKNSQLMSVRQGSEGKTSITQVALNGAITEEIESRLMINAAGNYALDIAHSQGLALNYMMLPLKGRYAISKSSEMGK